MRRSALIMGTGVVIDVPGLEDESVIKAAFDDLRTIDEQFSPYKPGSELSRFRRGEIPADELSASMKAVMKACSEAEQLTDGYFSARYHGGFDPSGYVKGWAVAEVKRSLPEQGYKSFCVFAGGDMAAKSDGQKTWRIGIQHPRQKNKVLGTIAGKNIAVATSGNYERGEHIFNPKTGKPADELLSVTVAGPDIILADIFATAAFVMGRKGLDFVDKRPDYEILAVDKSGRIMLSGGMAEMLDGDLAVAGKVI